MHHYKTKRTSRKRSRQSRDCGLAVLYRSSKRIAILIRHEDTVLLQLICGQSVFVQLNGQQMRLCSFACALKRNSNRTQNSKATASDPLRNSLRTATHLHDLWKGAGRKAATGSSQDSIPLSSPM